MNPSLRRLLAKDIEEDVNGHAQLTRKTSQPRLRHLRDEIPQPCPLSLRRGGEGRGGVSREEGGERLGLLSLTSSRILRRTERECSCDWRSKGRQMKSGAWGEGWEALNCRWSLARWAATKRSGGRKERPCAADARGRAAFWQSGSPRVRRLEDKGGGGWGA